MRAFLITLILIVYPVGIVAETLSSFAYKKLERAQFYLQGEKYQSVIDLLLPVIKKSKVKSLDSAMSWQLIGHAYVSRNQMNKAVQAYEMALSRNALMGAMKTPVVMNLAQLYLSKAAYQKCIDILRVIITSDDIKSENASVHRLLAQAYYALNQFDLAIPEVKKAILYSNQVNESWHQLLLSLYVELSDFSKAVDQLTIMTQLFPDEKLYWQQLASLYLQLNEVTRALETLQVAWHKNLLDEPKDIMAVLNLYAMQDLPFEAAEILSQSLAEQRIPSTYAYWRQLSTLYFLAKEQARAIQAMESALSFSNDEKDGVVLVKMYMAEERWDKAINILVSFGSHNRGASNELRYLLAILYYEVGEMTKANQLFSTLMLTDEFGEKAKRWVVFMREVG